MTKLKMPIKSERDIELARNALRGKMTEETEWRPSFQARVIAALTAIGEFIMATGTNGVVELTMAEEDTPGVTMSCEFFWMGGALRSLVAMRRKQAGELQQQLARVADDVSYENDTTSAQLNLALSPEEAEAS